MMPQPKDFVEGYGPYKTDPLYRQQLPEDEVVQPLDAVENSGKGKKPKKYFKRKRHAPDGVPEGPLGDPADRASNVSHPENSMSLESIILSLLDDSPRSLKRRWGIMTISVIGLIVMTAVSYGAFERFGISGFAHADSIKKATQPLEKQITAQTELLGKFADQLTDSLAAGVASDIRAKIAKRCTEANKAERERINGEIDTLQYQYKKHKGAFYIAPTCAEL